MKGLKLLFIGGGRSIHTYNLIELIRGYFDDVLLITDFHDKNHNEVEARVIDYSLSNPLNLITASLKINKIIRDYRPDFIINLQVDTGAFCTQLANNRHIPNLVIGMGSDILLTPYKGFLYMFMAKYILKRAKYFNTGADYVAKKMSEIAGKDLDVLVANFGYNSSITPSEKENIVYSNRLHKPLYRIPKIIEAFSRFIQKPERKDWRLVIGATGDEENLRLLAKRLEIEDRVEFIGWVDKERNNHFYSISKIWISIPESDCTPISLMEAMAANCIPVLSNLPSMNEWVRDGNNGVIAKDLESNYIERALEIDYDSLVKNNIQLMKEKGSKDANQRKFYSIFAKEFGNEE